MCALCRVRETRACVAWRVVCVWRVVYARKVGRVMSKEEREEIRTKKGGPQVRGHEKKEKKKEKETSWQHSTMRHPWVNLSVR